MTPEEKQKADAWMTLQSGDVVHRRICDSVTALFTDAQAARWMSNHLVVAESRTGSAPLKHYFERQLERNLRLILAEGVQREVAEILKPMIAAAVQEHAEQVDKQLAEMKRLKSKGPIHGRR
jgi:hypothetical protein